MCLLRLILSNPPIFENRETKLEHFIDAIAPKGVLETM